MRFDGKTVLVTGGALGIGRAACQIFGERGASVAIVDVDENAGRQLCVEIEQAGGKAVFYRVDVSNFDEVNAAA
jgi:NAD(P)-dependent dehydrogenase (short-subunit alcohol dehydrogenase family)